MSVLLPVFFSGTKTKQVSETLLNPIKIHPDDKFYRFITPDDCRRAFSWVVSPAQRHMKIQAAFLSHLAIHGWHVKPNTALSDIHTVWTADIDKTQCHWQRLIIDSA